MSCEDGCPQRTGKLIRSPRAVVTSCCEPVDVGSGHMGEEQSLQTRDVKQN